MTPWSIRQQTLFVKGNLRLTFRKRGPVTHLDVDIDGHQYVVSFDPRGDVRSVRPVEVDRGSMTG